MWGWVDALFLAGFAVLVLVAFLAGRAWERHECRAHARRSFSHQLGGPHGSD